MYVCICNAVTDHRIREAVSQGADTFEALRERLDVSTCCGCCECEVRHILEEEQAPTGRGAGAPLLAC